MREPQEVCSPFTQMLSLTAIGTPARAAADFVFASTSSARCSAPPRSISRNAFKDSLSVSAALTADSTVARADVSPPTMLSVSCFIVLNDIEDYQGLGFVAHPPQRSGF